MERSRGRRTVTWLVAGLAVTYAPVALTASWSAFVPGAPRLQEGLDRWVSGEAYATGPGSLTAVRGGVYDDHRVLMLVHTVLGATCLLLAVHQLVTGSRSHRVVGRVHVALVTTSMVAAMAFMVATDPGPGAGQAAFRWQLWILAVSTLATAWLAVVEARRGNHVGHRAWMTMHVAFLLTAPLLRLAWTLLAPLLPGRQMLANIESGAVLLAVVAPAGGALLALSWRAGSPASVVRPFDGGRTSVAVPVAVGVAGAAVVALEGLVVPGVGGDVWFHVVPALAVLGICAARVARAADGPTAETRRHLLAGVALMSWAAVAVGLASSVVLGVEGGLLAGLMVAPGLPVGAAVARAVAPSRDLPVPEPLGGTGDHLARRHPVGADAAPRRTPAT